MRTADENIYNTFHFFSFLTYPTLPVTRYPYPTLVRPAVSDVLGLKGSLKDGPNSYRVCSFVIMTPLYSMMLVLVGVS